MVRNSKSSGARISASHSNGNRFLFCLLIHYNQSVMLNLIHSENAFIFLVAVAVIASHRDIGLISMGWKSVADALVRIQINNCQCLFSIQELSDVSINTP